MGKHSSGTMPREETAGPKSTSTVLAGRAFRDASSHPPSPGSISLLGLSQQANERLDIRGLLTKRNVFLCLLAGA